MKYHEINQALWGTWRIIPRIVNGVYNHITISPIYRRDKPTEWGLDLTGVMKTSYDQWDDPPAVADG